MIKKKSINPFPIRKAKVRRRKRALRITYKYRVHFKNGVLEFVDLLIACKAYNELEARGLSRVTLYGFKPIKTKVLI